MKINLVCFDLDDTLTYEVDSVRVLGILHNKLPAILEIEQQEADGLYDWIDADEMKAKHLKGLRADRLTQDLLHMMKPIANIKNVIDTLHAHHIKSLLLTAGPRQVARVLSKHWHMDAYAGSDYEVKDGVFTGRIVESVGTRGKAAYLQDYCHEQGIDPQTCIAVGDGATDIPLFEFCKTSIAINYSQATIGVATHFLKTRDLLDILPFILKA